MYTNFTELYVHAMHFIKKSAFVIFKALFGNWQIETKMQPRWYLSEADQWNLFGKIYTETSITGCQEWSRKALLQDYESDTSRWSIEFQH